MYAFLMFLCRNVHYYLIDTYVFLNMNLWTCNRINNITVDQPGARTTKSPVNQCAIIINVYLIDFMNDNTDNALFLIKNSQHIFFFLVRTNHYTMPFCSVSTLFKVALT